MTHIWLVRHGETEWSRTLRHTGRSDIPLTPEGEAGAALLKPVLAQHTFSLVLTSPLSRAAHTAALAGFAGAEPDENLLEWDYGAYDGRTTAHIHESRPGWYLFADGCPEGEVAADVAARVARVIARAAAAAGDVLLFAHGHVLRVLTACYLGLPPEDGGRFVLDPATLTILGTEHGRPALLRWNCAP